MVGIMKILYVVTLLFLFVSQSALAEGECEIAKAAMAQASVIRKLKIKKPVPCSVRSREEVKRFILDTVETKIPPQKLKMEEVSFKALGMIPENFDYTKGMVDLYLSQLGGYYDPEKKHFVMAGWMPAMMQPTVASHELTHALQDQYYDLSKFIDSKSENSDEQLAHSALVEGDATAVMMDYLRQMAGQKGIEHDADVTSFMMQNVLGMSLTTGASGVPQSLQMMLLFPYTSGLRFAHHLLRRGSYAEINKAFIRPPRSTEEILHPEKYEAGRADFITFNESDFSADLLPGEVIKYRDTLGEFQISLLLGSFISDKFSAADAAAGWAGDRIVIAAQAEATSYVLVWKTNWDSERDAREFQEALIKTFKARFPGIDFSSLEQGVDAGHGRLYKLTRAGLVLTLKIHWPVKPFAKNT